MFPKSKYIAVIRADAEKVTAGGIVIPEETQSKDKQQRGYVLEVCQPFIDDNGRDWKSQFQKGDYVFFAKYVGEEIVLPTKDKLLFMKESDILAGGRDESDAKPSTATSAGIFAAAAPETVQPDQSNLSPAPAPPDDMNPEVMAAALKLLERLAGRASS
jgi:co-chaperonin GroES (HSP10)